MTSDFALSLDEQASVQRVWLAVSRELPVALSSVFAKTPPSIEGGLMLPFNLTSGQFVQGVSSLHLRAKIIDHYLASGEWDNRFISLSHAVEYGFTLNAAAEPSHVLTYASMKLVSELDESSGELTSKRVPLPKPYRAFQTVYHISQFDPILPRPDFSLVEDISSIEELSPSVGLEQLSVLVSSIINLADIDVQFHAEGAVESSVQKRRIIAPHPDLFSDPLCFYRVIITELLVLLVAIQPLPAIASLSKLDGEFNRHLLASIGVELLFGLLSLPSVRVLGDQRLASMVKQLSDHPFLAIQYAFCAEQLARSILSELSSRAGEYQSNLAFRFRQSSAIQLHEILAQFNSGKEAAMQSSESSVIRF